MNVDDRGQSARLSDDSSATPGKDRGGLSIPNFNNNQSLQFQLDKGPATGKLAGLFGRKRQTYLNHSQNTGEGAQMSSTDADPRSSYQRQPEVKGRKKQMMKKEVEEESFDLGSGTESALLDHPIDLASQMSMQSLRSLNNLVRKLYYQSQKHGKGTQVISGHDRMQIRQLTDQLTLDAHSMKSLEACLQFQMYIEQLIRIL